MTEEVNQTSEETTKKEKPVWGSVHINDQHKRRQAETPPTSKTIKRMWHASLTGNKKHVSLKQFARSLNDPLAKEWRDHKHGSLEKVAKKSRMDAKGGQLREIALASKAARRKTKTGGG